MNKVILVVSILALALSGVNTALLLQIGGKTKEAGEKVGAVAKELEKVQPLLQGMADKKPPIAPPGPGGTPPGPGGAEGGGEPKLPPKGPPTLPPGPFPPK